MPVSAPMVLIPVMLLLAHCGGRTEDTPKLDAAMLDAPEVVVDTHRPLPAAPTSCRTPAAGADHRCGREGTSDCCGTLEVDGGPFLRFSDASEEVTGFPATISDYYLDTFEVTVGRFRAFVNAYDRGAKPKAGVGASSHVSGSGWNAAWPIAGDSTALRATLTKNECENPSRVWTDEPGGNELLPMNCVTWYELFAFCAWDGGRLPTLAEREYAAAGGAEQRVYPWSTPPTSQVVSLTYALYAVDILKPPSLESVGGRPEGRGRWGHYDLGGSVGEFVLDTGLPPPRCADCLGLQDSPKSTVVQGGSFAQGTEALRVIDLNYVSTDVRDAAYGGRCARE